MIDFVGRRFWFFLASAILILAGIASLAAVGLKPGVDFVSGSSFRIQFETPVQIGVLRDTLTVQGYPEATIQGTPQGDYLVRVREISNDEKEALQNGLEAALGRSTILDFYSVSPVIAADTGRNAAIAVALATLFILGYVAYAFRKMPKPFRWGVSAIVPLLHDVFVVVSVFSITGWLLGMEINALFITGLLAVVGYSINNTIVVFDRIRDNLLRTPGRDFAGLVNRSVLESFPRSLNTSLTTLFVVFALYLFGGATIQHFMLVLLIGLVVGTFSSLCIAPQLLVVWEERRWGLPWTRPTKNR